MIIIKAVRADIYPITRAIQNKHIDYLTPEHVREDIYNNRLYKCVEKGKTIAIVSVVWDNTYKYYAIKRLCILRKENIGKHIASFFLEYIQNEHQYNGEKIGCTPWIDNGPMRHILEKEGFVLEYIFSEKWCFYSWEL